jgi:hypothetical protein
LTFDPKVESGISGTFYAYIICTGKRNYPIVSEFHESVLNYVRTSVREKKSVKLDTKKIMNKVVMQKQKETEERDVKVRNEEHYGKKRSLDCKCEE